MVSPCVDVLRNLTSRMNDDLGARQGKKHSTPDLRKDIDILMASLAKLDVYVEKEGRTLDPDEMPVPDAISVGLADLAHGSALTDFNTQFERNRERRRLLPISALLKHLEKPESSAPSSPLPTTPSTAIPHAVPSPAPSRTTQTSSPISPTLIATVSEQHVELPNVSDSSDSNSDQGGPAEEDDITADDFKPPSFSLETEADVAMDMDSVMEYFEDDDYPWEDLFGEYGSESNTSTDNDGADYESS
jgi:hypothetical protein